MQKATLKPKEIAKKRLAGSNIMKIGLSDRNNLDCKENVYPQIPVRNKKSYKHDRNTEDFGNTNPFRLPKLQTMFMKRNPPRKVQLEPFIMSEPFTVCDIDSTFYNIIEGRPIRQFNDIKVQMRNIRDITLFRANAAYLKDNIIHIDTSFAFELNEYENINELYNTCKISFAKFAHENFNAAKTIQNSAADKAKQLDKVTDELDALSRQFIALRNRVDVLVIQFENLSKYRHFLNSLSPLSWVIDNNQDFMETNLYSDSISTLENSINKYKNDFDCLQTFRPMIFFEEPKDLMSRFDAICEQCLSYMGIDCIMSNILKPVLEGRDYLKVTLAEELQELEELVAIYKKEIIFIEKNEKELREKFGRILQNEFQSLYASYESTKLFTCLQYTNTQLFQGAEDPKDSMVTLTSHLEKHYIQLMAGLDSLNVDVVKDATKVFFAQDLKMMQNAKKAQRDLRECDILKKALRTSFEPPRWKVNKKV